MSEKLEKFAEVLMNSYREQAVRDAQAANDKWETIASLFIKIGFAIGGIASTRLPGQGVDQLPNTYLGIILIALSIMLGVLQLVQDSDFFSNSANASRDASTKSFRVVMNPLNSEKVKALTDAVQRHSDLPGSSCTCPLMGQCVVLFISFLLILSELH